jgi:hypothetical protein
VLLHEVEEARIVRFAGVLDVPEARILVLFFGRAG